MKTHLVSLEKILNESHRVWFYLRIEKSEDRCLGQGAPAETEQGADTTTTATTSATAAVRAAAKATAGTAAWPAGSGGTATGWAATDSRVGERWGIFGYLC